MAVDKGYGSGKSVSANDSRSRARVAAGRMTKGKKRPVDNLVSKAGDVVDFIVNGPKETRGKYAELGVSPLKLASVAKALFSAGKTEKAIQVGMRGFTKTGGQAIGKGIAGQGDVTFKVFGRPTRVGGNKELMQSIRSQTTKSVFPRAPKAAKSGTQAFNERKSKLASKRQSDNWLKDIK